MCQIVKSAWRANRRAGSGSPRARKSPPRGRHLPLDRVAEVLPNHAIRRERHQERGQAEQAENEHGEQEQGNKSDDAAPPRARSANRR